MGCLLIASCFCFGLLRSGLLNLGICSFRINLGVFFYGLTDLWLWFVAIVPWVCVGLATCGVGFAFLVCCGDGVWVRVCVVCGFACFSGFMV